GSVVVDDHLGSAAGGAEIEGAVLVGAEIDGVVFVGGVLEDELVDGAVGTVAVAGDGDDHVVGQRGEDVVASHPVAEDGDGRVGIGEGGGGVVRVFPVAAAVVPLAVAVDAPVNALHEGNDFVEAAAEGDDDVVVAVAPAGEVEVVDGVAGDVGGGADDELLGAAAGEGAGPVVDGEGAGDRAVQAVDGAVAVEGERRAVVE